MKYFSGNAYLVRRMCFRAWALASGAAAYFSLPFEPKAAAVFACLAVMSALFCLCYKREALREYLWLPLFFMIGAAAGAAESMRAPSPLLAEDLGPVSLYGVLERIDRREDGAKLYICNVRLVDLAHDRLPYCVRLSVRQSQLRGAEAGDGVYVSAAFLRPLPGPVIAGGYDFSFFAYYDGAGAVGYAASGVFRVSEANKRPVKAFIDGLRAAAAARFRDKMPQEEAALAGALTVGMRAGVPEEAQEAFRRSGLSHLLAISGMHVAMAAGLAFFAVRKLLAYIPRFVAAYDARALAGAAAILAAGIYVLLAGAPVSAERAFIMAAILLGGVAAGRRATPMHNVGLAAVALLLWRPHLALHPGFQMSFFAVCAILSHASMPVKNNAEARIDKPSRLKKTARYFGGVLLASFAAGVATAPFSIYHFNQFSWIGLPANMIAVPLAATLVMPSLFAAVALMPLGLDAPFCAVASYALSLLSALAKACAGADYAAASVIAPSGAALFLGISGMALFYFSAGARRLWGILPVMAALWLYRSAALPDILIAEDGKLFALRDKNASALYVSDMRRNSYVRERWQERLALQKTLSLYKTPPPNAHCEAGGCVIGIGERRAVIANTGAYAATFCETGGIVRIALTTQSAAAWRQCGAMPDVLPDTLETRGALSIFIQQNGVVIRGAKDLSGKRPWRAQKA